MTAGSSNHQTDLVCCRCNLTYSTDLTIYILSAPFFE